MAELGNPDGALNIARRLAQPKWRAEALTGVAPYLDTAKRREALPAALEATLRIEHPNERGRCLRELATHLAECDKAGLYEMFRSVNSFLATRVRFNAIPELCMFSPVIAALAGREALREIWRAVRNVYRWWP
jgi:hypothetical protein